MPVISTKVFVIALVESIDRPSSSLESCVSSVDARDTNSDLFIAITELTSLTYLSWATFVRFWDILTSKNLSDWRVEVGRGKPDMSAFKWVECTFT